MKPPKFFCLVVALLLPLIAQAQSIRTLSYNVSNNAVIPATNSTNALTFSNAFAWSTNTLSGATRTNLGLSWSALTNTNAATTLLGFTTNGQVVANTGTNTLRFTNDVSFGGGPLINGSGIYYSTNTDVGISFENQEIYAGGSAIISWATNEVGFGNTNIAAATRANLGFRTNLNTLWTATNASNARSAIGLGTSNDVNFNMVTARLSGAADSSYQLLDSETDTNAMNYNSIEGWFVSAPSNFRVGIGLPLDALTNTSNVTTMRALAGSTNTNEPYSGTVALTNTNVLTFSNGVLLKIQ